MRSIKNTYLVPYPDLDTPAENFTFNCVLPSGTFSFHFKWLNNRWDLWVTLPDGTVRQAGVYPNVMSWSGHTDYGVIFNTSLSDIDFSSLFLTELLIVEWV